MILFPFLDSFLVSLSLLVVALVAQWLQVRPVKESLLTADRPRLDVVHAGGGLDDALALALRTQRMRRTEGPREFRPPVGVVGVGRPLTDVLAVAPVRPSRCIPSQFLRI